MNPDDDMKNAVSFIQAKWKRGRKKKLFNKKPKKEDKKEEKKEEKKEDKKEGDGVYDRD